MCTGTAHLAPKRRSWGGAVPDLGEARRERWEWEAGYSAEWRPRAGWAGAVGVAGTLAETGVLVTGALVTGAAVAAASLAALCPRRPRRISMKIGRQEISTISAMNGSRYLSTLG